MHAPANTDDDWSWGANSDDEQQHGYGRQGSEDDGVLVPAAYDTAPLAPEISISTDAHDVPALLHPLADEWPSPASASAPRSSTDRPARPYGHVRRSSSALGTTPPSGFAPMRRRSSVVAVPTDLLLAYASGRPRSTTPNGSRPASSSSTPAATVVPMGVEGADLTVSDHDHDGADGDDDDELTLIGHGHGPRRAPNKPSAWFCALVVAALITLMLAVASIRAWYLCDPNAIAAQLQSAEEVVVFQRSRADASLAFLDPVPHPSLADGGAVPPVIPAVPPPSSPSTGAEVRRQWPTSTNGLSAPLDPPRKLGLVLLTAGAGAKSNVDTLVRRFGLDNFAFIICHWDNATWTEFDWYAHVTSVRAARQSKFWYSKRFIPPEVAMAYESIWMFDDDLMLEPGWDPAEFVRNMIKYNIQFAQPSLSKGEHGMQGTVVKRVENSPLGHFTNFVEMMGPVISRGAYTCAWQLIPWDTSSSWGVDISWYPICGALGYCRFAVFDAYPVAHLDEHSFASPSDLKLQEFAHHFDMFGKYCDSKPTGRLGRTVCNWWTSRNPAMSYATVRAIAPDSDADAGRTDRCPKPDPSREVAAAVPWGYVRELH
ncbi:hypothetical protein GGF32_001141 [Allomyces javanicus]|nr:hypothetical protein GGF32_001141 [Allomyces javanicus]